MSTEITFQEMQELLQIKPHILRYWMKNLPIVAPRKRIDGKIVFSFRDAQILMRAKYLICDEKNTVMKASKIIVDEIVKPENFQTIATLNSMKTEVIEILLQKIREKKQ